MDTTTSDLIGQRKQRIENTQKLRELGIDPYPATAQKDHPNSHIRDNFESFDGKVVTLAGRLVAKREHGKLVFGDLQDQSAIIQIAIKKDTLEEDLKKSFLGWEHLKLLDIGDFIQTTGKVNKTEQGEITLFVNKVRVLAKSIRPLPARLEDKEHRFRRRYTDFAVNTKVRDTFFRKSKFWQKAREFMVQRGFIEVETPILELVTGGADAKPFVTHHNALDQDFYLRISSELAQKRLIGGGFEKVFVLGPNFRNEGIDDEHLQEFYQLEYYWAYSDFNDTIALTKDLYKHLAQEVWGKTKFTRNGMTFDLGKEWEVVDYVKVIKERFDVDVFETSLETMYEIIKKHGVEIEFEQNRNRLVDNLWKLIRKDIAGPAALINAPKFISPLAKSYYETPNITQRFQPIIAGSEVGNAYSELNDPIDQLERFLDQQNMRDQGDDEAQMLDIDFVEMLEYGMPPTSCIGFSERLFWFLEGVTAREGTLFPQMRHETEELTKQIYPQLSFQSKSKSSPQTEEKKISDLSGLPTRQKAQELLEEHVKEPYQRLHVKMVASAMELYAKEYNQNEDLWYITGLLHDLDYDKFPDEHPNESLKWFREWKYPSELIDAISAHAFGSKRTTTPPKTQLDFALIACDELSGLLYAYSLMRPTGFDGMEAKSVMKKFKDKAFAAKIDRDEIMMGVTGLGLDLKEHMQKLIGVFGQMEELKK